MLDLQS